MASWCEERVDVWVPMIERRNGASHMPPYPGCPTGLYMASIH